MPYDMNYSLSDQDILRINPRTHVYLYSDIKKFKNIDQLLYPYDSAVILYEWKRDKNGSVGHYVTINRLNNGVIEYMDSYGCQIDRPLKQLKNSSESFKRWTNQDKQYLLRLLINSNSPVSYNQYQLQSTDDGISTCGRYAVLRGLYKNLSLEDFIGMLQKVHPNPDKAVTMLTG